MELKVWVEGIQRIICGVTDATTCQDVVYVLAHATGKTGRFTLVEKWRSNERLLPPHEHPLKVLSKWGEYANDVQLILRRSVPDTKPPPPLSQTQDAPPPLHRGTPESMQSFSPPPPPQTATSCGGRPNKSFSPCGTGKDTAAAIKKSLTFSSGGGAANGCISTNHCDGSAGSFRDASRDRRECGGTARSAANQPPPPQQQSNAKDLVDASQRDAAAINSCLMRGSDVGETFGGKEVHQSDGPLGVLSSGYQPSGGRASEREAGHGRPPVLTAQNGRIAKGGGYPAHYHVVQQQHQEQWRHSAPSAVHSSSSSQLPIGGGVQTTVDPTSSAVRTNGGGGGGCARQYHRGHGPLHGGPPKTTAAAAIPNVQNTSQEPCILHSDTVVVDDARYVNSNNAENKQQRSSSPPHNSDGALQSSSSSSSSSSADQVSYHNLCNGSNTMSSLQHQLQQPSPNSCSAHFELGPRLSPLTAGGSDSSRHQPVQHHHHHQNSCSPASGCGANNNAPAPVHLGTPKSRRNLLSEFKRHDLEEELHDDSLAMVRGRQERVVYDARYRDLVRLINLQREKLSRQQADLTQYDAEITYWEEKQKDHERQVERVEREIHEAEYSGREAEEEVVQLDKRHLDDELEIGKQQENMLQSELTLLRSKLANCETELLQCKNRIRVVTDSISEDERWMSKEEDERRQREMAIMNEIEELQNDIEATIRDHKSKVGLQTESCDKFDKDVRQMEGVIAEKKRQVEGLIRDMKEANLESLTFTPSEEIRNLLEGGSHKGLGSSRKIIGSPRQLENAVPTSKNPHGIWV